jgi:hypothetical protein
MNFRHFVYETLGRSVARSLGSRRLPAWLGVAALIVGAAACDDSGDDGPEPKPGQQIVKPDPDLDPETSLRRGPYLNAPSPGVVTVSWTTDEPSSSRLELTPEGGEPEEVEGIVFQPVPTTEELVLAGNDPEGYQHEVVLDGLVPGQRYDYRILSAAEPYPAGTFVGPPEPGDDFRFFLFGDTRTNHDDHEAVIASMTRWVDQDGPAAFVLHSGDMVSTGGANDQWDDFFRIEGPLLSTTPIVPVYGNHEALLGRTIYEGIFATPPSSTSPTDRWFSVDVGEIHIAVFDPYSNEVEPHLDWLEEDLATSPAKFKILALHSPLYTYSNHAPNYALREELLPIIQAADVHLVVSGHNHLYERFFGHGVHFVVSGGGGAPLYGADDTPEADNTGAARIVADSSLHYVYGTLTGDQIRFETYTVPDETRIDCWIIDAAQPGAELSCP